MPNSSSSCSSRSRRALRVGLGDLEHGQDILLDRQAAEDRGFLRQIAEAEDRPAVHRQVGDVLPVEEDAAAVGPDQAHDRIEAGRLAGAVGPEQPDHLAALNVERDVVEHRAPVIGLGDRADFEPADRLLRLGRMDARRSRLRSSPISGRFASGHGEVAGDPAAALVHPGRSAVDHRPAGVEVDHQPRSR